VVIRSRSRNKKKPLFLQEKRLEHELKRKPEKDMPKVKINGVKKLIIDDCHIEIIKNAYQITPHYTAIVMW